jgi:uncharacterized protein YjiS (DUF1127 family)
MSAHRAVNRTEEAANANGAARQPIILFLDRELVHTREPAAIPATSELWGVGRAAAACRDMAVRIAERLHKWGARARSRRALASMDARMRRDIGLTDHEVWREVNKPFWHE